jgi:hypothetical protein
MTTPWSLKSAHTVDDECDIVFTRTVTDPNGVEIEETQTVKHLRTSFGGTKQTVAKWKANIKQEVAGLIASMNADDQSPAPKDITSDVSP